MTALGWRLAHGVAAACSLRCDGDLHDPLRRQRFLETLGQTEGRWLRQVHAAAIVDADTRWTSPREGDGLITRRRHLPLVVFGADCPGLIVATPGALAVAHCGWRGTAAGIVEATVAALRAIPESGPVDRWQAFIGPGICGPCYEVDAPVLAHPWPPQALAPGRDGDHRHLDLVTAIRMRLRQAGISDCQTSGRCTACSPDLHSYRHQGPGAVQALVAWRC
jgi:YfiH family protein